MGHTSGSKLALWNILCQQCPLGEVYDILIALPTPTPGVLSWLEIAVLQLSDSLGNLLVLRCFVKDLSLEC